MSLAREFGDKLSLARLLGNLSRTAWRQGDVSTARALLAERLQEIENKWAIADTLALLSELEEAVNRPDRATALLGASESVCEEVGIVLSTTKGEEVDNAIHRLRALLGEKVFVQHWTEGRAMTVVQAIEYARAIVT